MGWLVRNSGFPLSGTVDEHLRETFTKLTKEAVAAGCVNKVLASSMVGKTWYAAIHTFRPYSNDYPEGQDFVTCAVVLTCGTAQNGFGYKDMDESMGPNECACPAYILDLLTPVELLPHPGYAADWRARCRDNRAEKARLKAAMPKPGDHVSFADPPTWSGVPISKFIIVPTPNRVRGIIGKRADGLGGLYRLSSRVLGSAVIETPTHGGTV